MLDVCENVAHDVMKSVFGLFSACIYFICGRCIITCNIYVCCFITNEAWSQLYHTG